MPILAWCKSQEQDLYVSDCGGGQNRAFFAVTIDGSSEPGRRQTSESEQLSMWRSASLSHAKPRGALTTSWSRTALLAVIMLHFSSAAHASACLEAARAAELRNGIPSGLLAAIGKVESGSWSWSVNGNDSEPGQRFDSAEEAERYAQGLLAAGKRMIDLGCFQIDLLYHQDVFQQWQDAFDSELNAQAAAGILSRLHQRTGDWNRAVALYHSADPNLGQSYLHSVMNAWEGRDSSVNGYALLPASDSYSILRVSSSFGIAVWGPGMAGSALNSARRGMHALPKIITP
ncbi:MAG: transglycosylase SLT domain-containing protein [Janthinobacterium lividum]